MVFVPVDLPTDQEWNIQRPRPSVGVRGVGTPPDLDNLTTIQPFGSAQGIRMITVKPGRQPAHALPFAHVTTDAERRERRERIDCVASGFGWRYVTEEDGTTRLTGIPPPLRAADILLSDLPANGLRHAECLIMIKRRFADR